MKTLFRPLKVLTLLALLSGASARAVQLVVWDPQLQTKLGYGEVVGGKLNVQLVADYSGPVVALFSKETGDGPQYAALNTRYSGQLRGGTLTLNDGGTVVSLSKFLSGFKLTPSFQNTARTFSLPGLKTPAPPVITLPNR